MSNKRQQRNLNRERVRRCREYEADCGRVRLEVYVDQEMAHAIRQMAEVGSTSLKSMMEDLLRTGLRIEEQIPATFGFWQCINSIAERYR